MQAITLTFRPFAVVAALFVASLTVHAQLASGTVLVVDRGAGTGGHGALFAFSGPQLSNIRQLADFGNLSQAQTTDSSGNKVLGVDPISVSAGNNLLGATTILVADDGAGTDQHGVVFKVDPISGNFSVLSDFGNDSSPLGTEPDSVKIVPGLLNLLPVIWVTDADAGDGEAGAVFSINPLTGARSSVTDGGDPQKGPRTSSLIGLDSSSAGGPLLLVDNGALALWSVDLSGKRTLAVNFTDPTKALSKDSNGNPVLGVDPLSVSAAANLVLDDGAGTKVVGEDGALVTSSALFSVNLASGTFTRISDFGNPAQDPPGVTSQNPLAVKAVPNSSGGYAITVLDEDGELYNVNPTTGKRTLLLDFSSIAEDPVALEIVQ